MILDPTLALAILTHPFQLALMALAIGALAREGIRALASRFETRPAGRAALRAELCTL